MIVVDFTKETAGASIKEAGKTKVSYPTAPRSITPNSVNNGFSIDFGDSNILSYNLVNYTIKINTVDRTSLGAEVICDKLRDEVFPKAGGAASLTSITTKTDDTAAFAALTNGQGADFEVGGIISRYSKNAAGTTFKNYNTYP